MSSKQAQQIARTVLRNYSPHAKDAVVDENDDVRVLLAHDTPEDLELPRHVSGVRLIVEREDAPGGRARSTAAPASSRKRSSDDADAAMEGRILERLHKALGEQVEAFEKRLDALEKRPPATEKPSA